MRHRHYNEIVAWAEGKQIQLKISSGEWWDNEFPNWTANEYRVKPEPLPDIVETSKLFINSNGSIEVNSECTTPNIEAVFDAETKKLKTVKVLT